MKHFNQKILLLTVGILSTVCAETTAGPVFNPLIGNPFVFCSSPRPCKQCQPYRKIYSEICDSQPNAKKDGGVMAENTQQLETQNTVLTVAQVSAAKQEGTNALIAAIERGDTIVLMDENTPDPRFNAVAAGWNSEWAKRR